MNTNFDIADAVERATLAAVAPQAVEPLHGWLLAFDTGTIGRAKSAVPLGAASTSGHTLRDIAGRYRAHAMAPSFRIADHLEFKPLRTELAAAGYQANRPTWVQIAATRTLASFSPSDSVDLADDPDHAWAALFLGEGFDPVDGASRVQSLRRATGSLYASVREHGHTVAAGAVSFSHGWVSVHGMRTDAAQRGRGLAGRILSTAGAVAQARGIDRCFLQVEEHNAGAQSLYRRAGFETAWRYGYWTLP